MLLHTQVVYWLLLLRTIFTHCDTCKDLFECSYKPCTIISLLTHYDKVFMFPLTQIPHLTNSFAQAVVSCSALVDVVSLCPSRKILG